MVEAGVYCSVTFVKKKLTSAFQFSTGRFPPELAKTQPKAQTHLLTFVVRHTAEGCLHHGFCGF